MAVPGRSASTTFPVIGAVSFTGWSSATICGRPVGSPKRTSDRAALPRTSGEESVSNFCIVTRHSFADLHQRLLDVAGMRVVLEILAHFLVRQSSAEPGIPPEPDWHEGDEPG